MIKYAEWEHRNEVPYSLVVRRPSDTSILYLQVLTVLAPTQAHLDYKHPSRMFFFFKVIVYRHPLPMLWSCKRSCLTARNMVWDFDEVCEMGIEERRMEYGTVTTYVLVCTCCPHIGIRVQE